MVQTAAHGSEPKHGLAIFEDDACFGGGGESRTGRNLGDLGLLIRALLRNRRKGGCELGLPEHIAFSVQTAIGLKEVGLGFR